MHTVVRLGILTRVSLITTDHVGAYAKSCQHNLQDTIKRVDGMGRTGPLSSKSSKAPE